MDDLEARLSEQEKQILRLRAEKAELATRVANLTRLHDNAQNYIGRLQAMLNRQKSRLAEQVFGGGRNE